ncbi:MAG: HAD family hydrolase [Ruminococcaceae bacterium]|nr:HAD family hydrolase [Oscillospiraceae bacterium]
MYKYAIFDLDGTLLNTLEDLADAGNYALKTVGLPTHETEKYKYFVGNGIPVLIKRICPDDSDERTRKEVHKYFSEYYEAHCVDKTRPYDGIADMLSELKKTGIGTGVVTNKDHSFSLKLIKDFFGDNIEIVCGRKDGFPKKPDPYSVNYVTERFNADKRDVLYVGDSNVDMETAKNAGVDSCGVLWGFRTEKELIDSGAKYIAATSKDLLDIIYQSLFELT